MLKLLNSLTSFVKKLFKIKIIKKVLALITLIFSYKIVKYFWNFNKIILYCLSVIFAGISWDEYSILNEIKLGYDAVKLYILSFFNQDSGFIKNKTIETKNDIKQIIYKNHTNISNEIDDDYVYVIADKFPPPLGFDSEDH